MYCTQRYGDLQTYIHSAFAQQNPLHHEKQQQNTQKVENYEKLGVFFTSAIVLVIVIVVAIVAVVLAFVSFTVCVYHLHLYFVLANSLVAITPSHTFYSPAHAH